MARFRWLLLLAACGGSSAGPTVAVSQGEADRACVLFGSCLPDDGVNDCYTDTLPSLPPDTVRCLATASSCTDARTCMGVTLVPGACTGTYSCDGHTLVSCSGSFAYRIACGSPLTKGPLCVVAPDGLAHCGAGTCSAASQTCSNGDAQSCNTGISVLEQTACADADFGCAGGVCTDAGGGGACMPSTPPHCDGTAIASCTADGIEQRIDCARRFAGSRCQQPAGSKPFCGGDAYNCAEIKGAETCSGTFLTYCANGVTTTVDCASFGSTCTGGIRGCASN